MIDPNVRQDIADAIVALETESLLPDPVRADALPGAVITANEALLPITLEQVSAELAHLISDGPVFEGGAARRGYTKTDLLAAVSGLSRPALDSSAPANEDTDVALDLAAITLTFDAPVTLGAGTFTLWLDDSPDVAVQTWDSPSEAAVAEDTITLTLSESLVGEATYYLTWTRGVVARASDGVLASAANNDSFLSFTAAADEEG